MTYPRYIERKTRKEMTEKVYGKFFIDMLYGKSWLSRVLSPFIRPLFTHVNFLSRLYGSIQKSKMTRKKIKPFIRKFHVDASEFLDPVDSFQSFNDFFIRKLKPEARPLASGSDVAVLPADGRYFVYENVHKHDGFFVKGKKFCLKTLLRSCDLADKYAEGSMIIARLAPVDYHRFHFPMNCIPEEPQLINGPLYSVNPIPLRKHMNILAENKRAITRLKTENFGSVLFIEVGATYVGSIHQTFTPHEPYAKGDEKGYFSFGGSSLILLFEPNRIQFDQDLIVASNRRIEILGQMGQSMCQTINPT